MLEAFGSVDRAEFCNAAAPYEDRPQDIGMGQNISSPYMHAIALEAIAPHILKPGSSSLDIGCGSGWLTTAISVMASGHGGSSHGIDHSETLIEDCLSNTRVSHEELLAAG